MRSDSLRLAQSKSVTDLQNRACRALGKVRSPHGLPFIEFLVHQLKEELGLDHYEGRNWQGWHHHVTMVMVAHAFLTLKPYELKNTSGWTLPRTRREIQYILFTWTGVCAYCGAKARNSRSP